MEDKVKKSVNTQVLLQKVALTPAVFIGDVDYSFCFTC